MIIIEQKKKNYNALSNVAHKINICNSLNKHLLLTK